MSRYKYPETVFVATGNDFCQGMRAIDDFGRKPPAECRRCLIGHAVYTFLGRDTGSTDEWKLLPKRVQRALIYGVNKVFPVNRSYSSNPFRDVSKVYTSNDDNTYTRYGRAKIAKAWNIAMAYLGYTENNPETK